MVFSVGARLDVNGALPLRHFIVLTLFHIPCSVLALHLLCVFQVIAASLGSCMQVPDSPSNTNSQNSSGTQPTPGKRHQSLHAVSAHAHCSFCSFMALSALVRRMLPCSPSSWTIPCLVAAAYMNWPFLNTPRNQRALINWYPYARTMLHPSLLPYLDC